MCVRVCVSLCVYVCGFVVKLGILLYVEVNQTERVVVRYPGLCIDLFPLGVVSNFYVIGLREQ